MSRKTTELYIAVLRFIINMIPELLIHLQNILCDFERAEILALRTVFPNATITGCVFHFKLVRLLIRELIYNIIFNNIEQINIIYIFLQQNILKKWDSLRVSHEFVDFLNRALIVPFLTANRIPNFIGDLVNFGNRILNQNLQNFLSYLDLQWTPLANIVSVFRQMIRTNNICETFHHYAHTVFGDHPPFWSWYGKYHIYSNCTVSRITYYVSIYKSLINWIRVGHTNQLSFY